MADCKRLAGELPNIETALRGKPKSGGNNASEEIQQKDVQEPQTAEVKEARSHKAAVESAAASALSAPYLRIGGSQ